LPLKFQRVSTARTSVGQPQVRGINFSKLPGHAGSITTGSESE